MNRLAAIIDNNPPPRWDEEMTEHTLNKMPLPVWFRWRHDDGTQRPVQPRGGLKNGYGFWLRYTPYFPGLFEAAHRVLKAAPWETSISARWLAGAISGATRENSRAVLDLAAVGADVPTVINQFWNGCQN